MSQPSIPNITPIISVTKKETISLLLSSIAMSELAISHLINAEAEKMQSFVHHANHNCKIRTKDYLKFNSAVSKLVEDINMEQWLALNKMDRIICLIDDHYEEEEEVCEDNEEPWEENDCLEDNFEE
jgi:predicted ATPase